MNTEIDNYPVSELQSRYNLGKQAVYNRLDALDIKPFKEGNKSYITADQVRSLDELHQHIANNGTMADFIRGEAGQLDRVESPVGRLESPVDKLDFKLDRVDKPSGLTQISEVKELVKVIAQAIQPQDPLQYMVILERAAASSWILTTSEVRQLIGVKPRTEKDDRTFARGCWVFTKSGKIGGQTGWRVMKQVEGSYKA